MNSQHEYSIEAEETPMTQVTSSAQQQQTTLESSSLLPTTQQQTKQLEEESQFSSIINNIHHHQLLNNNTTTTTTTAPPTLKSSLSPSSPSSTTTQSLSSPPPPTNNQQQGGENTSPAQQPTINSKEENTTSNNNNSNNDSITNTTTSTAAAAAEVGIALLVPPLLLNDESGEKVSSSPTNKNNNYGKHNNNYGEEGSSSMDFSPVVQISRNEYFHEAGNSSSDSRIVVMNNNSSSNNHKDFNLSLDDVYKRKSISIVSSLDIQPIGLHKLNNNKKKRNNSPSSSKPSSTFPNSNITTTTNTNNNNNNSNNTNTAKGGLFMFFNNPRNSITRMFRTSDAGREIDDDMNKIQQEIVDHERRKTTGNSIDEEAVDEETKSFYKIIRKNEAKRRGSSAKQLETPRMDGSDSFMVLDASPRIQSSNDNSVRTAPIQNVAMSPWTRVNSTIAFKLMEYCSLFEVRALSRLNQEWLSFVKGYFNNHCNPENLRTCLLLLYYKLMGIFSHLRADVSMEDRHLKSVYSVLLSHKHLLETLTTNAAATLNNNNVVDTTTVTTPRTPRESSLGDLFLNTYLNNLFNIIPRIAYYTAIKNDKKVITFSEIQFSLTVEIFLRDETQAATIVNNNLDTYDIERYVQHYSAGSFATQLITTSMAHFSVYYLKLQNNQHSGAAADVNDFTNETTSTSYTNSEARRATVSSSNTVSPNIKGSSFSSSLKNLKFESNFEDTIEMFRSPRTPVTPSSANNSFKVDKGEFLIAKGYSSNKMRRESTVATNENESAPSSDISSVPTPNISFIEIIPKDSSELGYLFLLEFFKILSKYFRRLTFSRKPNASERFRMDFFSTMSLSPNCETFSAFIINEEIEFKKNSKKFENVCNSIAFSEALTCLVMGGKEWTQEDVNILFNSFSTAADEIKRDNYKVDLVLPSSLEISERCTKPKLRQSIFLPPSSARTLVHDINISELHHHDSVTSPRIQTNGSTIIQSSTLAASSPYSPISCELDEDIIRWPNHVKRVYLTDINENLIFHERWLNGGPGMQSLHFNFSLSSPINFDPICLCPNLRHLHVSDCVLSSNKNTALNLVNAIKKLDKLESLSLERVSMENGAWIQLVDDVLTTSPTLSSFRVVDSINQTPIVSAFVHASKMRPSQLDKIELKLKGFGEKDKLMINSLIEQLMLHGNAKTVIADCKFQNPNHSGGAGGDKDKHSKKPCIVM